MSRLKVSRRVKAVLHHGPFLLAFVMLTAPYAGFADELTGSAESQEAAPEQLHISETDEEQSENRIIRYHWIGGRLDRVTVEHSNGLHEVYQNSDARNNLWNADETELGDRRNVRQWRLGDW